MDYKKIWKKTEEDLKRSLPAHAYEAWIAKIEISDAGALAGLLDAAGYAALIGE